MAESHTAAQRISRVVNTTFRVRYAETDAMGIVHHSSYVVWMEMGRTEFMRAHGFTYLRLEQMGILLPVIELNVLYKQPAYYDDELCIGCWVAELSRVRLLLRYSITRTSDRLLLTQGSTLHTFMGRDGRPLMMTRHPEAWEKLRGMVSQ